MTKRTWAAVATAAVLLLGSAACADDDGGDGAVTTTTEAADSGGDSDATGGLTPPERADGPAATVAGPLTAGRGIHLLSAGGGPDLAAAGWVEEEFTVEGTAVDYETADGEAPPADGHWDLVPGDEADYRTRIVVRRPGDAADFDGTVVVEWLNVSAGADSSPDYTYLVDELVRGGYAWVGVSVQSIGVEGGDVAVMTPVSEFAGAGQGLKAIDAERYGDLTHPGDAFAYDIFTQVARALRTPGDVDALGGLEVERLLGVGESQSAFTLTSYIDGVQPLTGAFDGFLVHSRGGAAAPLRVESGGIDIASSLGGEPTLIRTDGAAPIIVLETENDVVGLLGYLPARQPDDDRLRLWEMAGTSHADLYQVGGIEDVLGCPTPVNAGPQHFVVKAALRHLTRWITDGTPPPEAPRLEVDDATGTYVVDDDGIVAGGIRTPLVDVPVDRLSGEASPEASVACLLFGSTTPLADDRLAELYPDADTYLAAFEASADEVIAAGFVLDDDRDALLAEAQPDRIP